MKRGQVVGELWATRKVPDLTGRSLKLVVESSDVAGRAWAPLVVAIDTLDARNGDEVLVAYGSGARNVLMTEGGVRPAGSASNRDILCDAAIALIIDSDPAAADS